MLTFLELNGLSVEASDTDLAEWIAGVAATHPDSLGFNYASQTQLRGPATEPSYRSEADGA
jgi:prophage maintenance system killer protein